MPSARAGAARGARGAGPSLGGPELLPARLPPGTGPREPRTELVWLPRGERGCPAGFRCQRPGSLWGRGCRAPAGPPRAAGAGEAPGDPARPARAPHSFSWGGGGVKITLEAIASAMGTSLRRAPSWEKSANHFSLQKSGVKD